MPSAATGAKLANRQLMVLGISGDGDTASIGFGQYCHMIRRNLDITYIVEDNGCYGLTKGQFSATADRGSVLKKGQTNELEMIDVCGLAIELGATFVARSFSGDGKQLVPLLQAAFAHRGTAVLDVISPCVTFNDHEGSTKSYAYVKEHDVVLHQAGFIHAREEITVDYEPGTVQDIVLDDGSHVTLRKLEREYDPNDRIGAMTMIHETRTRGELVTGLLFIDTAARDLVRTRAPAAGAAVRARRGRIADQPRGLGPAHARRVKQVFATLGGVAAVVLIGGYLAIAGGIIPANADAKPSAFERWAARTSLNATIRREAPAEPNPLRPTEENFAAGIKLYGGNCAVCHGAADAKPSNIALGVYQPAPQLAKHGVEDDPDGETFWKVKHGIRLTAMPSFARTLSDGQIWQLTLFLKNMDRLPPQADELFKSLPSQAAAEKV